MILELKGIYKKYFTDDFEVPVLKDINLSVEEGDYLAIMGPSGSGKSTLMNIIGCLDKQTEGTYLFDGIDISSMKRAYAVFIILVGLLQIGQLIFKRKKQL